MRPYDNDLRERIVRARLDGSSACEVAKRFRVGIRSVERYYKSYLERGDCRPQKLGHPYGSILDKHKETIMTWVAKEPGLTLEQIANRCDEQLGFSISVPTLCLRLKHYGLRYKKNADSSRAEPS